ncbi:hotdog domain-containing protein [Arthrobacter cryoconiti]|uniref:hotdog domain-containing protein n=1 Tax=Arthrobacter cryoconiti TaxID=748907 RepID=UPI003CD053E3
MKRVTHTHFRRPARRGETVTAAASAVGFDKKVCAVRQRRCREQQATECGP